MKRIFFSLTILCSVTFFSCKEVGPNINLSGNGTDTSGIGGVDSTQQKNVLLEDFTATNCPNCPKARAAIDNLTAIYPGRVTVVEVHQGILSVPLLPGDPVLKTQDGEDLAATLGPPPYWPIGAVDQKAFEIAPDDFEILVAYGFWSSYVPQELDSVLKVKLGINTSYDDGSRQLTGSVTVDFLETITEPLNLTVLITESGIVAAQVNGVVTDSFYVHRDVLRDILTSSTGNLIQAAQLSGSAFTYNVPSFTLPVEWNADSCNVITFVSKVNGSYDVLQSLSKRLK